MNPRVDCNVTAQERSVVEWFKACKGNVAMRAILMADNIRKHQDMYYAQLMPLLRMKHHLIDTRPEGVSKIEAIRQLSVTISDIQSLLEM
jgi:D-ribose pyranose/furanose isomerase RbsD